MYALRERRVHVTQEDFELAVAKVIERAENRRARVERLLVLVGDAKGFREERVVEKTLEVKQLFFLSLVTMRSRPVALCVLIRTT